MGFWDLEHFDTRDALNETIWKESPAVQAMIQPYRDNWQDGEIGAQQVMRHPRQLRWVPDLVGTHWRSEEAPVVVGSAYGPFIKNAHGQHEMTPPDYDQPTASSFLPRFVQAVVASRDYYAKVAGLAQNLMRDASYIVVLDLCRVAFVQKGDPRDIGGDRVANCAHELFTRYVESPRPRAWLWQRFTEGRASTVVALGTVAEHGLLRMFASNLQAPTIIDSVDSSIEFTASESRRWPARYAHRRRKLKARSEEPITPLWLVSGVACGVRRSWRVAVVPHPTGAFDGLGDYPRQAVLAAHPRPTVGGRKLCA